MSKFALLFIMVFFGGVIATFSYSASSAVILYQLVYFLNPDNRWWSSDIPGLSYSFITAILMMLALAVHYRKYSQLSPWRQQPWIKWMLALLALYYIISTIALVPSIHDRFTFDFLKLIITVLVAYKLVHSKSVLHASIWAYLIGATYIGYLATVTGRNSGNRVEGIGLVDSPDANGTAAALVPAAALLMYYAWLGNKRVKLLCVFCGALIANGLVLINSRGAFLGGVVGGGVFLLYMIFSRHRREGQRVMAIAIIVLAMGGGYYVTDDQFWERMDTINDGSETQASEGGRVNFWVMTFEMAKDYPYGVGVHGYNQLAEFYLGEKFRNKSVHSLWFQGLSEVGWVGIGLFFLMLLSLYQISRKAIKYLISIGNYEEYFLVRALQCALLSYLVSGSFINQFRAVILYWMILLLGCAVNVYYLQVMANKDNSKSVTKLSQRHTHSG